MGTAGRRLDGGSGGTHLPPLAPRSGSASPSKLAPASLLRGGSRVSMLHVT